MPPDPNSSIPTSIPATPNTALPFAISKFSIPSLLTANVPEATSSPEIGTGEAFENCPFAPSNRAVRFALGWLVLLIAKDSENFSVSTSPVRIPFGCNRIWAASNTGMSNLTWADSISSSSSLTPEITRQSPPTNLTLEFSKSACPNSTSCSLALSESSTIIPFFTSVI